MQNRIEATDLAIIVNNGNYKYMLDLETGSKVRVVPEPPALPEYPETVDLKITNTCFGACPWCHESSTPKAPATDWERLQKLLYTFPGGVEVAIGGGDPIEFPFLEEALKILIDKKNVPSITVNTRTLAFNADRLLSILEKDLVYGLGISVSSPGEITEEIKDVLAYKHSVLHVIAGIVSPVGLEKILDKYSSIVGRPAKVLILGYKDFGRGKIQAQETRINVKNKTEE